ncbi:MAG TPA: site-specific integrase [Bryobacteraceae bacterium]
MPDTIVGPGTDLITAAERVRVYLNNTRAANTYKAYAADWRDFEGWCAAHRLPPLPAAPQTVMLYLSDLGGAGKKASTIGRRLAALAHVHRYAGYESPSESRGVRELLAGMRRLHGTAAHGKEALLADDLRAMIRRLGASLRDRRDRALLLVGFAGAFRRSELTAIQMEDVKYVAEGMVIDLRRSKTDQEGQGREVPIPFGPRTETCPVAAFRGWVADAKIKAGPVFRSISRHGHLSDRALTADSVALLVKERAEAAGLDPAIYAGHSLRAGFATSAALGGAPEWAIMKQTGHRSRAMLDRYVRVASRFRGNAAAFTGL